VLDDPKKRVVDTLSQSPVDALPSGFYGGGFAASEVRFPDDAIGEVPRTFWPTLVVTQNVAWQNAKDNIQRYINENLKQVKNIYWVAIGVMVVGFGFILAGVVLSVYQPTIKPSLIAAVSGVISQFIGVTFMVIYRSTMQQASEYFSALVAMDTISKAVDILDSIPETSELKNTVRTQMATMILDTPVQKIQSVKTTTTKKHEKQPKP